MTHTIKQKDLYLTNKGIINTSILASLASTKKGTKKLSIINTCKKRGKIESTFRVEYTIQPYIKESTFFKKLNKAIKFYNSIIT